MNQVYDDAVQGTSIPESLMIVPTSPAINAMLLLITQLGHLDRLCIAHNKNNHSSKYTYAVLESGRAALKCESKRESVTVTCDFSNENRSGYRSGIKKLFIYLLCMINKQIFYRNISSYFVEFSLKDIVDNGLYRSTKTARAGCTEAFKVLSDLKVEVDTAFGQRKKLMLAAPFIGSGISRGRCTLQLNPKVDWNMICEFYTAVPADIFRLSSKAFDLAFYCCYLLRIKKPVRAEFTVSIKSVQERLGLPMTGETKCPTQCIKEPVIHAIEEINDNISDIQLYLDADTSASIRDFLNGMIKVKISGDLRRYYYEHDHTGVYQMKKHFTGNMEDYIGKKS